MVEKSTTYQDWMKLALEEARLTESDVPVGCLVLREGRTLAKAHNERERSLDPTAHAEILALRAAACELSSWRLSGCILVVTLEPCAMCAEAIIQSRISTLVFGAFDALSGACGSKFNLFVAGRSYPLPEIIGGIDERECELLLVEFFQSRRRRDG